MTNRAAELAAEYENYAEELYALAKKGRELGKDPETEEDLRARQERSQELATMALDISQELYEEKGFKPILLEMVALCDRQKILMPEWLGKAIRDSVIAAHRGQISSWDDAFGRPHPKGAHLAAIRKKWKLQRPVFRAVEEARQEGRPVDDGLFEEIGRKFGLGKTLTADYYYGHLDLRNARYREKTKNRGKT